VIVLLFGAPGTGKSTYGRYLATRLGVPWISSGQLLREVSGRDERVAKRIEAGELVPDEEVERVLHARLDEAPRGFVLDGYPRTVAQARRLLRFLEEREWRIARAFHISAPDEVVLRRLQARGREDDRPEVIRERLRVYREQTEPVLDTLRQAGVSVVDVDNTAPVEEVQSRLDASLAGVTL
jgi:adenylate kinase